MGVATKFSKWGSIYFFNLYVKIKTLFFVPSAFLVLKL